MSSFILQSQVCDIWTVCVECDAVVLISAIASVVIDVCHFEIPLKLGVVLLCDHPDPTLPCLELWEAQLCAD